MKIAVIGGGIAGLTAAIACARKRFDVTLFETASAIEEVGAGIQLSPNATSRLTALDLDLAKLNANQPNQTELFSFRGPRLMSMVHQQVVDAPYLQVHRADLINLLVAAAGAADVKIQLGTKAQIIGGAPAEGFKVKAKSVDKFDMVISADGVHSETTLSARAPVAPKKCAQIAWRGLIDRDNAPQAFRDTPRIILGPRRHIVTYPLRCGALINLVAVEEVSGAAEQGWTHTADPTELRAIFADFGTATHRLMQSVHKVRRWALSPHNKAEMTGAFGQPVIGDAALTMLPFMSQGAGMAIEDAYALAEDLAAGQKGWSQTTSAKRKRRKEAVMKAARKNGWIFHFYPPVIGPFFHLGMGMVGRLMPSMLSRRYAWIYEDQV